MCVVNLVISSRCRVWKLDLQPIQQLALLKLTDKGN